MPVINATVPNTISGGLQILTASPFMASLSTQNNRKFIMDLLEAIILNIGGTDILELDDSEYTVPLMDSHGYYIRADRMLRAIQERGAMRCINNIADIPQCMTGFCAVLATDPNRIIILDCLPRSTFVGGIGSSRDPVPTNAASAAASKKAA